MLWDTSQTDKLKDIIKAGARQWTAAEVREILDQGARHKPPGYDEWAHAMRLRYEGKQQGLVMKAMEKAFPETWERMPVVALNTLRLIVSQDAGVYDQEPTRFLESAGKQIAKEDPREVEFQRTVDEANLQGLMPEAERRAIGLQTLFLVGDWDTDKDIPSLQVYWPSDVVCVCHRSHPGDLSRAVLFAHRCAGPDGVAEQHQWYRMWSREWNDEEDGSVTYGAWSVHVVSTRGDSYLSANDPRTVPELNMLPVAVIQVGRPEGSVFVDGDRDLGEVIDSGNLQRSNIMFGGFTQGHTPIYYAGNHLEGSEITSGPDSIIKIGPGEMLGTLPLSPAFADLRENQKQLSQELARTRNQTPDAYTMEPGAPLSGVSRRIQNEPHERHLRRLSHSFRLMEEKQLLPMLMALHDTYADASRPRFGEGVFPRMKPSNPVTHADPVQMMQLASDAISQGLISKAQAAVMVFPDLYPTVDDATKVGIPDKVGAPSISAAPSSGLAARFGSIGKNKEQDTQPDEPAVGASIGGR